MLSPRFLSAAKQEQIDRLKAELTAVKSKIDRINNGFADGSLDIQEFKELKNPLVPRKVELEQQITALEKSRTNRLEPLKKWILKANLANQWVFQDNWLEMKSFLQKVGLNRLVRSQTLTVSFKKPWNYLAETTVAAQRAASESERNAKWWRRWELKPFPACLYAGLCGFMRSSNAQKRTGTPPNCYKLLQRDGNGKREKRARKTAKENEIETG